MIPRASAMVHEAAAIPANHGLAEDILRLRPDLVLAGAFTTPVTVAMLRRLGLPVEIFPSANDMEGIRTNLHRMGKVLGRQPEAAAIVQRFDADLAALAATPGDGRSTAIYAAGGYSSGANSLAGAILSEAGLRNVAVDLGLPQGGFRSLERLVLADPDIVVTGPRHPRASRAEEVLDHPALRAITAEEGARSLSDSDWICGTPHVLRAIAQLKETTA